MKKAYPLHPPLTVMYALAGLLMSGALLHLWLGLSQYAAHPDILHGDAYDYHTAARWLYQENFRPHPTRMFGFPLLTGWITRWDDSFQAFQMTCCIVNIGLWLLTGFLLLRIGGLLFGPANRLSYVPLLFFALQIGNTVMVSQAVTETLYTFLVTVMIWRCVLFLNEKHPRYLLAAFAVFCFSMIVRPTADMWLVIILPALLWFFWQKKQGFARNAGIALLCLAATLGVQSALMKARYGIYGTSNIGLLTYYLYADAYANTASQAPEAGWQEKGDLWQQESKRREAHIGMGPKGVADVPDWQAARDTMLKQCARTWTLHKKELLVSYTRNLISNTVSGSMIVEFLAKRCENAVIRGRAGLFFLLGRLQNAFSTSVILFAALWTFIAAVRRRKWPGFVGWMALFGASVVLLSAVSFAQGDRFHIVLAPLTGVILGYLTSPPGPLSNREGVTSRLAFLNRDTKGNRSPSLLERGRGGEVPTTNNHP